LFFHFIFNAKDAKDAKDARDALLLFETKLLNQTFI